MTSNVDFDRLLGAWLHDAGPSAPEASVVDEALALARSTARRRGIARLVGPSAWPPARGGSVRDRTSMARLALVIALVIVVIAVAVFAGAILPTRVPPPLPTTAAATASPTAEVATGPLDGLVRADWVAETTSLPGLSNGAGPVSLSISPDGSILSMDNFAPGASFLSHVDALGPDLVRVTLIGKSAGCSVDDVGTYRTQLSSDRSELTFSVVDDACANRAATLGRTWMRSLLHPTATGAGVIDSMDPAFFIALPDGTYEARTLDDFAEIGQPGGVNLLVFKDPQGFADPCSTAEERYPYTPGADAVVAFFRQNDAWTVEVAEPMEIDGHHAIHLVTRADPAYSRCPNQDLYMYTPKACVCHFIASPGWRDNHYLVDVGQDTFMFVLDPGPDASVEQAIVDSIRIPVTLPEQ